MKIAEKPRIPSWRGPGLEAAEEYAKANQCVNVNLGLLSKGNRDLTTQRSHEILHLGGILCAERTPERTELYREHEAVCSGAAQLNAPNGACNCCTLRIGVSDLR